jgi:hypothetical protein
VPVVLAPGIILVALAMLILALVCTIIVVALLERISFHIPKIGDVHIPGVHRIARAVEAAWRDWLVPHVHVVTGWLDNVATHIREFPRAIADYLTDLARQLDHYAHTVVHQVIQAFLRPVRALAAEAHAIAAGAAAAVIDLRNDARGWVNGLRDSTLGWLAALRADVHGWVIELRADAFDAIDAVHRQVVEGVLPRLGAIEVALPDLRDWLRRLEDWANDARTWYLPIAAVFSGAAAVELLRHVQGCRAGSDRLCSVDPSFLDELLGILFITASISELQAFVRTAAPAAGALADEFLDRD